MGLSLAVVSTFNIRSVSVDHKFSVEAIFGTFRLLGALVFRKRDYFELENHLFSAPGFKRFRAMLREASWPDIFFPDTFLCSNVFNQVCPCDLTSKPGFRCHKGLRMCL